MSVRKLVIMAAVVLMASLAAPSKAAADWLFTPYIGWNWGGTATFGDFDDFDDEFEQRANFGGALGWMGAGIVGFEVDFGYAPNFFENTGGTGNFEFGDNNVTTLMANLLVGAPIGGQSGPGLRPYGAAGVGLIRTQIGDADDFFNIDSNDWGINVGGGVVGFVSDNVGIRGDVRYFRSLQDVEAEDAFSIGLSDFSFWRGSVGVTFRW